MKDKQLILENFCQHRNLTVDFNGMIGIVGPNGSGKSHIREALIFAKTGYLESPKKDYITFGETKGYVTLVFVTEEDGMTYKVTRSLHNGDITIAKQTTSGWELLTNSSTEARALTSSIIPLSSDLATYMYASGQNHMTDFVDVTPAGRAKIFSGIFALQFLEKDRKKIREILKQVETRAADAKSRLLLLEDQLSLKRSIIQNYQTLPVMTVIDSQLNDVINETEEITTRLGADALRSFLKSEIAKYEVLLENCNRELLEEPPQETEKESGYELLKKKKEKVQFWDDAKRAMAALKKWNSRTILPEVSEAELSELQQKLGSLQARTQDLKAHYEHIVSCGTSGKCPTCGHELDYTEADLTKAQALYMSSRQEMDDLKDTIRQMESDLQKYRKVQHTNEQLEETLNGAFLVIHSHILPESELAVIVTSAQSEVEELDKRIEVRDQYEKDFYVWDRKHQELLTRRETLEQKLHEMKTNPALLVESHVDEAALNKRKEELAQKYSELQDLRVKRVQYDACRAEIDSLQADVNKAKEVLEDTKPRLREYLEEIEGMLQSKCLPAKVLAALNKVLTAKLNVYLTEFNAPYSIDIKPNGDFVCTYENCSLLASRLSGGEKMVLSVALRLALHSLFASEDMGGFVILDEPTTFMDENNRKALVSVLTTIKQSPKFKDLQIVVITHDAMMIPVFDTLIRLDK